MATSSKIGKALELIASETAGLTGIAWATTPAAKWYPDFDVVQLKAGLTAFVLPEIVEYSPETRERKPRQNMFVFCAVAAPITGGQFSEGDEVVEAAELIEAYFFRQTIAGSQLRLTVIDAKLEPAISLDFAKQHNIWCAIVKMEVHVE